MSELIITPWVLKPVFPPVAALKQCEVRLYSQRAMSAPNEFGSAYDDIRAANQSYLQLVLILRICYLRYLLLP